jgi:formamidopyrimidine-DNA glycosylase
MTQGTAGLDPLSDHFTLEAFTHRVNERPDVGARAFLLDRDVLTRLTAGLADQVLARAQVADERPVGTLSGPELHRLHRAIRDVLGHELEGHHGYGD